MELPSITRISREDLKEAPGWIDKLLYPINLFMGALHAGLNKNITHSQNIRCVIKDLRLDTPADYSTGGFPDLSFVHGLGVKPFRVSICQINEVVEPVVVMTSSPFAHWVEREGKVIVQYIAGLENSKRYAVRLLVS